MVIASSRAARSRTVLMLGLGVAAAMGCGGGGAGMNYRDGGTPSPGAGGTAGISTGGGAGQSGQIGGAGGSIPGGSGGSETMDAGTALQDAAPPAPTNTAVFLGPSLLIGPGLSCSRAPAPAAGAAAADKWCGIMRPGATNDVIALYVMNLTKALAGVPITCAASDPNCRRLTPALGLDANATHGFFGQTFIYYDQTAAYAWRPGWTAGRKLITLSSTQPVHCEADLKDGPGAVCIQKDVAGTGFNAYAGNIATQAGAVLPAVEPLGTGTISFSPDATAVLYSVDLDPGSLGETLKMQTIGDDTSRKIVAMNVTSWSVSRDATRWYWISAPVNTAIGGGQVLNGTLQTAPYPAGVPVINVQEKAVGYASFGTKGVVSLSTPTAMGTDLKAAADADNPTTTTTMLEAGTVFGLVDVDASGNVVYFDHVYQPNPKQKSYLIDLRHITADGSKKCVATADTAADASSASLIASSKGLAWVQVLFDIMGMVTSIDGVVTTLADCVPHTFAPDIGSYTDTTTGLVFQNAVNSDQQTADLSYAPLVAGAPGPATLVQGAADYTIDALAPDLPRVVFSVTQRPMGDGIYISPVLAAGTPALAPVRGTVSVTRPASPSILAPTFASRGLPTVSTVRPATSRFSPFDRTTTEEAKMKSARFFARLAVPPMLRRP